MIQCSFLNCKRKLKVENNEVFAVKFYRKDTDEKGIEKTVLDGHRWVCKGHYDFITRKRIFRPLVSMLTGRKNNEPQAKRGFGFRAKKSNKNTTEEHDNSIRKHVPEIKS